MTLSFNRRGVLTAALTLAAMQLYPKLTRAQAKRLVFSTFTGSWEEAHRDVLVPAYKKLTGAEIVLDPMLSVDQIAKVTAARANPPIDVMLHDPGPGLVAVAQDLVQPFPVASSKTYQELLPVAQIETGPAIFFQVVGLTYNPDKIKSPPKSWNDLWKPEYKGRVGITNMNSTLGTGFMVELAKLKGGGPANIDPAFDLIKALQPNLAAVAANPGALATLYQQGQVDIGPGNFNAIQLLKARGVPVEFAIPDTGAIAFPTTIHIVKNTKVPDLAAALIEAAMSEPVQAALSKPPYSVIPTNKNVKIGGDIAKFLVKDQEELGKRFVFQDWKAINQSRAAWIERFNKEIKS